MRVASDNDTFRVGNFAVITTWPTLSLSEPRYGVVQYDDRGPILRMGPFTDFKWACKQCRRVASDGFIAEQAIHPRRRKGEPR